MTEFLYSHPLLRLIAVGILGIAIGDAMQASPLLESHNISITTLSGYALMLCLFCAAIFRRYEKIASIAIICAMFTLGIFLIKSERHTYAIPYASEIEQMMEEKRMELSNIYQAQGLTDDEYAIVAAMTLGERYRVSAELREVYSITGASHLFALSGLHLGIIYMLLTMLRPSTLIFRLKHFRKPLQLLFTLFLLSTIWAYVLLVGCHPSIMRAAIMLTTYTIARHLSQHPESISVLAFTCALLLVIYPEWLFDVGFQMSFMAVLSITILYVPLRNKLFTNTTLIHPRFLQPMWGFFRTFFLQMLLLSFCAQIGVTPLIILYFGRFSCYFLLTNLFTPILTTLIIYLAVTMLVLGSLSSFIPTLCAIPLSCLTTMLATCVKFFNSYLTWIASLPYSSIDQIHINAPQTFLLYVIITNLCLLTYHLHHGLRRRMNKIQSTG